MNARHCHTAPPRRHGSWQHVIVYVEHVLGSVLQVEEDMLDDSVVNLEASGLQLGGRLKREGLRLSLTVRQVLKVKQNLLKLTSR